MSTIEASAAGLSSPSQTFDSAALAASIATELLQARRSHQRQRSFSACIPGTAYDSFPNSGAPLATKDPPTNTAAATFLTPPLSSLPFALPSIASMAANLAAKTPSRRQSHVLAPQITFPRAPLNSNDSSSDISIAIGDENPSSAIQPHWRRSILGDRPRSRSFLSVQSVDSSSGGDAGEESGSEGQADTASKRFGSGMPEQEGVAKKRSRTLTTPFQQRRLMQVLEQTRFPSTELREQLARELGMTPRRVQIWFQNRRQGMKKAMGQRAESEADAAAVTAANARTMSDYRSGCGYSFGTYPTIPSTSCYASPTLGFSASSQQQYAYAPGQSGPEYMLNPPRSLSTRGGMARHLPHLQLGTSSSSSSLATLAESPASFAWSTSTQSGSWQGSDGFLISSRATSSIPGTADSGTFVFDKSADGVDPSQTFSQFSASPAQRPGYGRQRSYTNPEPAFPFGPSTGLPEPPPDEQQQPQQHQTKHESGLDTSQAAMGGMVHGMGWARSCTDSAWPSDPAKLRLVDATVAMGLPTGTSGAGDTSLFSSDYSLAPAYPSTSEEASAAATGLLNLGSQPDYQFYPVSVALPTQPLASTAVAALAPFFHPPGHFRQRSRSFNG